MEQIFKDREQEKIKERRDYKMKTNPIPVALAKWNEVWLVQKNSGKTDFTTSTRDVKEEASLFCFTFISNKQIYIHFPIPRQIQDNNLAHQFIHTNKVLDS